MTDTCVCGGSRAIPNADCERCQLIAEIARLRSIIAVITAPPMTREEAEAALDDLPELDQDERDAPGAIDINKIIAYATDPTNMSGEEAVRRLIEKAKACPGFDAGTLGEAEAWLERRCT